jgi:hypothetical protein
MKPIPIGELTKAVQTGKPIVQYKIDAGPIEMHTFSGSNFVWIENGYGKTERIFNPTLAEAIRKRCER